MKIVLAVALAFFPAVGFAEGFPDPDFGVDGLLMLNWQQPSEVREYVADGLVDAQGRYVSIGYTQDGSAYESYFGAIKRRLASGAIDTSLAGNGSVRFSFEQGSDTRLYAGATQDGRIVVAGTGGSEGSLMVCRFDSDSSFDSPDIAQNCLRYNIPIDLPATGGRAMDVAIQPDGKIVVLSNEPGQTRSYRLTRINQDGSLDGGFGLCNCGSMVSEPLFGDKIQPAAIAIDPVSGQIVVAGFETILNSDIIVTRHHPDGLIDKSFAGNGFVFVGFDKAIKADQTIPFARESSIDKPVDISVHADDASIRVLASIEPVEEQDDPSIHPREFMRAGIVKILSDGTVDEVYGGVNIGRSIFRFELFSSSTPGAMTQQPDGSILVAGKFQYGDNREKIGVIRIGNDGRVDPLWSSESNPEDGVAFSFDSRCGYPISRIKSISMDGEKAIAFGDVDYIDAISSETWTTGFMTKAAMDRPDALFADAFEGE